MKSLALTFLLSFSLLAQSGDYMTTISSGGANSRIRIENKTWTFGSVDTTQAQEIDRYSTVFVSLMTTDTVSVIMKYQLSMDGTNWGTATTFDSLRQTAAGVGLKTVNISSVTLGYFYIRFLFSYTKSDIYTATTYTSSNRKVWAGLKVIP